MPISPGHSAILADGVSAARQALEAGDLEGARQLTLAMTSSAPKEPQAWAMRARALRACGEIDAADVAEAEAISLMAGTVYSATPALSLRERMRQFSTVTFLGGPAAHFVEIGQMQLMVMLEHGLEAHHRVLDIGCGALRAGL